MKHCLALLFFGILLSCSKPGTDTASSTDSLASDGSSQPAGSQPVTLNEEEMERVNFEIFLMFHDQQLYGEAPEVMAYQEDFTTHGNDFTYVLLRHNGTRKGWRYANEGVEGESDGDSESESDDQSDPYGESEPYSESEPEEPEKIYTNELDTVEIRGTYMAFLISTPESTIKTIKVILTGSTKLLNFPYESYGEIKTYIDESTLNSEFTVELSVPRQLARHDVYLKAKIADLTEQDLAGLSKENLTILRNEIFARHGHTFKTDKMISYFSEMEWYHSLVDDAQSLLNKFEKRNVDFIKKREG